MTELSNPPPDGQMDTWRVEVLCPNCTHGPASVRHVEARLWIDAVAAAERATGVDRSWLRVVRINR